VQICKWYTFGQPYAIGREEEFVTVFTHFPAVNSVDYGAAVAAANVCGGRSVFGQVDVKTALGEESLGIDRWHILLSGPVPQVVRRSLLLQLDVHRDGMALVGANQGMVSVEGIPLLVVGPDDLFQRFHVDLVAGRAVDPGEQRADICPAVLIEGEPDGLGLMAENEGYEFA